MKRILYITIGCLLTFSSCSNESEEAFGNSSLERIEHSIQKYDDLLKSSEYGWKMKYFPNETKIGGYNFLFKFDEGNKVKMATDFRENEEVSTYSFYGGQGVVLSFDTYNFLHILADPSYMPAGTGYRGDYEMIVERVTPDSLICLGRKWKQPMVFTKATAEDWTEMDVLRNNEMVLAPLMENVPFFRNVRLAEKAIATFLYEPNNRFIEYYYLNSDGRTESGEIGVVFSREGFSLKKEININGVLLKDFVFDSESGGFTFGEQGTLTMEHESAVEFKDAWDDFYKTDGGGLYRTSKDFLNLFNEAKELEPGLTTLQLYWNMNGLRMFSFIFIEELNKQSEETRPIWFHSLIGNIKSPEDDCAIFQPYIDKQTGLRVVLPGSVDVEDDLNRLFVEENESSKKMGEILDFFYDPSGFTIIPTADGKFYLISKSRSNYWLMFNTF